MNGLSREQIKGYAMVGAQEQANKHVADLSTIFKYFPDLKAATIAALGGATTGGGKPSRAPRKMTPAGRAAIGAAAKARWARVRAEKEKAEKKKAPGKAGKKSAPATA